MTRNRKWIIIAIQLAAIALITIQYLRAANALGGMMKVQSTAVQEEFDEMVAEGVITLHTDAVSPAQRVWNRVFDNDEAVADRCQSWQPFALLGLLVNIILIATTSRRSATNPA